MLHKFSFFISCLVLLGAIFIVNFLLLRPEVIVVDKGFDRLPVIIEGVFGEDIKMTDKVVRELDTDASVFRNYFGKNNIVLYIGYYGTKKGGRTGHNPNACYPSSGFAILDEKKVALPVKFLDENKTTVELTRLLITKDNEKQIVYHWYQSSRNQILSNGIEQNIHRFKMLLLHNRNDGAFVRVSATVKESIPATENNLIPFIGKVIPLIEQHWPIEKDAP